MKKNVLRGFAAGVLCLAVTLAGSSFSVLAEEPAEKALSNYEDGIAEYSGDVFDFTSDEAKEALLEESEAFPASFDLRNVDGRCFVTPVKLQNPFLTCWGFAAVAAAETSILGSLLYDDPDAYKTLNLSEKQLAYFSHTPINDPTNSQNGEGTYTKDSNSTSIYVGGLPFLATSTFASGIGPCRDLDEFEYKGRNGYTEQRFFDGKYRNFSYSAEDDWSIPEGKRFMQDFVLSESFVLPCPAQIIASTGEYTYNPAGTAAIKEQLINKRAVEIGFHADQSSPNQETGMEGTYLSRNWAHYTYERVAANHAVTIIGWDDNYPAENFVQGHEPRDKEGNLLNGAWLVKNSWGSGEVDFPNKGNGQWGIPVEKKDAEGNTYKVGSGYFWLSYYDQTLFMPEALAFDTAVDNHYFLDEYDLMPVSEVSALPLQQQIKTANVFSAEACQRLKAISCQTASPQTTVTYEVYLLSDSFESPVDGILMESGQVIYKYGGFHKINLKNPFIVQKGQSYAIVIQEQLDNGSYQINVPKGEGKGKGNASWQVGVINEKESYVNFDGRWLDYSDAELRKKMFGNAEAIERDEVAFDNFPIKGFSDILPDNINMRVTGDATNLLIYSAGTTGTTLGLKFTGDAGREMGNPDVKWNLAEGGEKIVSLTPNKDGTRADLQAVSLGKTWVIISIDGIGTKVVPVVVGHPKPVEILMTKGDSFVYTGKAIKPEVTVYTTGIRELKEGVDYTLSYKKNIKCGEGYVIASAITDDPAGEAPASAKQPFNITPAKAKVSKLTAGKNKLTIKIKDQYASGIDGYQIQYRIKGTKEWTDKTLKSGKTTLTLKKLKKGKQYEVRACGFIKIGEAEYNGKYSKIATSDAIK